MVALLVLAGLVLLAALVSALMLAGWLGGRAAALWLSWGSAPGTTPTPADDDVECACCGLSPLESVRSATGEGACPCCGRRHYRAGARRRRKKR